MYGIVDSPMVASGDSARRSGMWDSPIGTRELDDGLRDVHSGELAMEDRCLLVRPMASLGGPSMLMLSRSIESMRLLDLALRTI
jgi:hypothetical protein